MSKAEELNSCVLSDAERVDYSIDPCCVDEVGAGVTLKES